MIALLYRVIHGFISSGLTETQYRNFAKTAGLGSVEHTYLDTGINNVLNVDYRYWLVVMLALLMALTFIIYYITFYCSPAFAHNAWSTWISQPCDPTYNCTRQVHLCLLYYL